MKRNEEFLSRVTKRLLVTPKQERKDMPRRKAHANILHLTDREATHGKEAASKAKKRKDE